MRRLPAPRRNQPAARLRLQSPRRPADHRNSSHHQSIPRRRLPRPLRREKNKFSTPSRSPTRKIPSGARSRLLHSHRIRIHPRRLGAQNAILGGGTLRRICPKLSAARRSGIGFAIGEDRLVLSLSASAESVVRNPTLIAPLGAGMNREAAHLARELRRHDLVVELGDESFRLEIIRSCRQNRLAIHPHCPRERDDATDAFASNIWRRANQLRAARGPSAADSAEVVLGDPKPPAARASGFSALDPGGRCFCGPLSTGGEADWPRYGFELTTGRTPSPVAATPGRGSGVRGRPRRLLHPGGGGKYGEAGKVEG